MFEVTFNAKARKGYERLPPKAAQLIDRALPVLERDPFAGPNIKRLHGDFDGLFRLRVGPYRIIYEIDGEGRVVILLAIGPRGQMY
jgi:mRNA interferase RelE/StbE